MPPEADKFTEYDVPAVAPGSEVVGTPTGSEFSEWVGIDGYDISILMPGRSE